MASFVILILLFSRIFPQLIAMNTDISMIASNLASVKLVMGLDADLPEPVVRVREERAAMRLMEGIRLEGDQLLIPLHSQGFRRSKTLRD